MGEETKMIELEVLVEVNSTYEQALDALKHLDLVQESFTEDIYYIDPLRGTLQPKDFRLRASFRLRNKGNKSFMTYKDDYFQGDTWLYSDEQETEIGDFATAQEILKKLGFEKMVVLKNLKRIYHYDSYEVVLESVENLGNFLEVELKRRISEEDVISEKEKIQAFIDSLRVNCSPELNCGKPELYLRRNMQI